VPASRACGADQRRRPSATVNESFSAVGGGEVVLVGFLGSDNIASRNEAPSSVPAPVRHRDNSAKSRGASGRELASHPIEKHPHARRKLSVARVEQRDGNRWWRTVRQHKDERASLQVNLGVEAWHLNQAQPEPSAC
jgi:hypothetical protein